MIWLQSKRKPPRLTVARRMDRTLDNAAAMLAAFEEIHREDRWTNGSGPGSHPDSTIEYRAFLARFMEANGISSVTDLGCGDWQFSRFIDWSRVRYTGLDVVPAIIDQNAHLYAGPTIEFRLHRSLKDLPGGDLLIAKEVLQHLPNETVLQYLTVIARRYRFALLTNAVEPAERANVDVDFGDWRPLRLDLAPFSARGAVIFNYFPQNGSHFWKNGVFLLLGN
jgi:SAM-dependent methyltransferase